MTSRPSKRGRKGTESRSPLYVGFTAGSSSKSSAYRKRQPFAARTWLTMPLVRQGLFAWPKAHLDPGGSFLSLNTLSFGVRGMTIFTKWVQLRCNQRPAGPAAAIGPGVVDRLQGATPSVTDRIAMVNESGAQTLPAVCAILTGG